jgi:hypothetical protein
MRWMLFAASLFMITTGVSAADMAVHSSEVGRLVVRWRHSHGAGGVGDVVEVYKRLHAKGAAGSVLVRLYRYKSHTFLASVTSWCPPVSIYPKNRGVLLTSEFSSGSGKEFVILAQTTHGFRQVFRAFSNKVGDGRSLEIVDLDGDGYPEIICVPTYDDFRGVDAGKTLAQVWKWNSKLERYDKVRESAYADRLKPLSSRN